MDERFYAAGEYIFRGIEYRVSFRSVNKPAPCLSVEVEDKVTGDQWKGMFDSSCEILPPLAITLSTRPVLVDHGLSVS